MAKDKNQLSSEDKTKNKSVQAQVNPNSKNDSAPEEVKNIRFGSGINLVPKKTKEEVKLEETKSKFNVGAALSILLFVLVSLLILGYRYYNEIVLKNETKVLTNELEPEAEKHIDTILKNQELNRDILLYESIQEEAVPYEDILRYWEDVSANLGSIQEISINQGLSFSISGEAENLEELTKLWHFMCVDEAIAESNLESFSLGNDGSAASFEFDGKLNYQYFVEKEVSGV